MFRNKDLGGNSEFPRLPAAAELRSAGQPRAAVPTWTGEGARPHTNKKGCGSNPHPYLLYSSIVSSSTYAADNFLKFILAIIYLPNQTVRRIMGVRYEPSGMESVYVSGLFG
jgi:hypothetical protein